MIEQRKFFRHKTRFFKEFLARLQFSNSSFEISADILNASDGGVLVSFEKELLAGKGNECVVQIATLSEKVILSRNCEIAWQANHPEESELVFLGLRFTTNEPLPLAIYAHSVAENDSQPELALA